MKNPTRYTVTTRSVLVSTGTVAVLGSFAKKSEALTAAEGALAGLGVTSARVAREVYEQDMTEFVCKNREVWSWNEEAEVKNLSRRPTQEEVAAVMAAR